MDQEPTTAVEPVGETPPATPPAAPAATKKPAPKPSAKKPAKKEKLTPGQLLKTIRDKHHDADKGDMSYIKGDSTEEEFTAPAVYYPTGLTLIDTIIGNGGFGSGRICEVYGPNKTGKSELVHKAVEAFLVRFRDGLAMYWDQEQAADDKKKKDIPIFNSGRLSWEYAANAERLFGKMINIVNDINLTAPDTPIFLVVDSLAALETAEEAKMAVDKKGMMGPIAQLMSRVLRKLKPMLVTTNTFLLIVNQIRHRPNQPAFVDDESPGGEALKFWADYRIKTSPGGSFWFKKAAEGQPSIPPDGLLCKFKTVKNKLAPPLRTVTIPLLFAKRFGCPSGLSDVWGIFNTLQQAKIIGVKGNRFVVKDEKGEPLGESFMKSEWPMVWLDPVTRAVIQPAYDRWARALMLQSDESIEDVTDMDMTGPVRRGLGSEEEE